MENRQIMNEQHRKDVALQAINNKVRLFFFKLSHLPS